MQKYETQFEYPVRMNVYHLSLTESKEDSVTKEKQSKTTSAPG
jgi:hypothetical protein